MNVEIPKGNLSEERLRRVGEPAWFPLSDSKGNKLKPLIRCNCGLLTGIGLHHVHADER